MGEGVYVFIPLLHMRDVPSGHPDNPDQVVPPIFSFVYAWGGFHERS